MDETSDGLPARVEVVRTLVDGGLCLVLGRLSGNLDAHGYTIQMVDGRGLPHPWSRCLPATLRDVVRMAKAVPDWEPGWLDYVVDQFDFHDGAFLVEGWAFEARFLFKLSVPRAGGDLEFSCTPVNYS